MIIEVFSTTAIVWRSAHTTSASLIGGTFVAAFAAIIGVGLQVDANA
jgi:hypothetical protein